MECRNAFWSKKKTILKRTNEALRYWMLNDMEKLCFSW
jgi:hypothetical protein